MKYTDDDILELVREGYRESGMKPACDYFESNGCCCGLVAAAWSVCRDIDSFRGLFAQERISKLLGRSINWVYGFMSGWDDNADCWNKEFVAGRQCGAAGRKEHIDGRADNAGVVSPR